MKKFTLLKETDTKYALILEIGTSSITFKIQTSMFSEYKPIDPSFVHEHPIEILWKKKIRNPLAQI